LCCWVLGAGAGAGFGAFWAGWDDNGGGGSRGALVRQGSAPRRDSDMAGACFGRFADVGTELEDDATALDLNDFAWRIRLHRQGGRGWFGTKRR